jgi:hypothetical protein
MFQDHAVQEARYPEQATSFSPEGEDKTAQGLSPGCNHPRPALKGRLKLFDFGMVS